MARIRTVKPEFWQDEKLSPLDPLTRLVFLGLISQADDAGRLIDSVRMIDGLLFPFSEETCGPSLDALHKLEVIVRYRSESDQPLIQITNWEEHQKVKNPSSYVLPGPEDTGSSVDPPESVGRSSGEATPPIPDPRSPIMDQGTTTATASPAEDVENSGEKRASESPLWTDAEILELAHTVLGRRQLTNDEKATNKRILQTWLYSDSRDRTDIVCAIEGAADMRDKSMIGWEGLSAKDPMTLKALNGPRTLADQGDGKAQRDFFDVAVEHTRSRREPRPPPNRRGGGPKPIGDLVQATGAA